MSKHGGLTLHAPHRAPRCAPNRDNLGDTPPTAGNGDFVELLGGPLDGRRATVVDPMERLWCSFSYRDGWTCESARRRPRSGNVRGAYTYDPHAGVLLWRASEQIRV